MGCVGSQAVVVPIDNIVISIFGVDNAGKTCLLRSLAGNFEFDSVPTIGLGQERFKYNDNDLTVYDLGGNSKFRSVWTRFFAEIWGYVWVVDASDKDRFEENKKTLKDMFAHKMLKGKPLIVVANKQDKEGAVPAEKLRTILDLPKKVKCINAIVTQCNKEEGKCNEGVSQAISDLVDEIVKNYASISQKREKDMAEQKKIDDKEKEEKRIRLEKARAAREAKAKEEEERKAKEEEEKKKKEEEEKKNAPEGEVEKKDEEEKKE